MVQHANQKSKNTNVYILLDRSGSMSNLWDEAICSINVYVEKLEPSTKVMLSLFDSESYDVIRDSVAKDWKAVSSTEYKPRAMTPLNDACGKIMTTAEAENPDKAVLVVMTDGYENNSKEYTLDIIRNKIKEWETDKKWEIVFLGANFDNVDVVSHERGVPNSRSVNYAVGNFVKGMTTLSGKTNAYSMGVGTMDFTATEIAELGK